MIITSADYGFVSYLIIKYDGKIEKTEKQGNMVIYDIKVNIDKLPEELIKEYNKSEFSEFNEILKYVIKKGKM